MKPFTIIDLAAAALVIALAIASPGVQAAPNDGRFQQSVEGLKIKRQLCADLKLMLDVNEAEADKRAGTKAAKPYAEDADKAWADGEKQGCSWAQ
jgi:hypothetical protein